MIYVPDEDPGGVFVVTAYELRGKAKKAYPPLAEEAMTEKQKFPPVGMTPASVGPADYEKQGEDEQFAEIEAAREAAGVNSMAVPTELVPEIRAPLARKQSAMSGALGRNRFGYPRIIDPWSIRWRRDQTAGVERKRGHRRGNAVRCAGRHGGQGPNFARSAGRQDRARCASPSAGASAKVRVKIGEQIKVGQVIGLIEERR